MARKRKLSQADIDLDLTPMIDVIFLLIIFFILAGRITAEITNNKITVPPTITAEKWEKPDDWEHYKIEVWGSTQDQAGAGQAGAVTRLPSTTALVTVSLTSAQVAPACSRSGLTAG